eukprot:CAMPEP_0170166440 /NCGR_PEP_ID=MMETSP0040_2-20121228/76_1 /TAXON_ID=641309 /ORGANISM="Lotharella oceanica, Strain CCMP622" /LENGTH=79 /DNA_ID=CAMNT_0010404137 /DNA_START=251 /DNA_END=487 /DNA_ORIENTATION=+
MEHLELLRRVLAAFLQKDLLAAGVVFGEFGDIVDTTVDDNPAIIILVVFGHFGNCVLLLLGHSVRGVVLLVDLPWGGIW